MSSLDSVPVEILAHILNGESSLHAVDLWKCGSRILNYKLTRGGVTDVRLEMRSRSISRWPRCLKEFKLERLSVTSNQDALCSVGTLRKELKQLSGDLKELKIVVPGVMLALFGGSSKKAVEAGDEDEDDEPRPAKRSKLAETTEDGKHEEIWNLDVTWPHMERLTIGEVSRGLAPSIFALLPRSLVLLSIDIPWADAINDYSALPPKLETLHLPCVITSAKAVKTLPRSITDIGDSIDEEVLLALAKKPALLPNLAHFPWAQDEDGNNELKEWLFEEGGKWPQTILSLLFGEVSAEQIFEDGPQPLPQSLQTLSVVASYSDYEITRSYLEKSVPKSLTELRVEKINFSEIDASMWPSGLIELTLSDTLFGIHWFHKLPRSLTKFDASMDEPYDDGYGADVPPFEHDVALANGRMSLATLDHELWQSLKAKLALAGNDTTAYIDAVESGRLFGLPLGLKQLLLSYHLHRDEYTLLIPPSVTSYETEAGKTTTTSEFFELLPPSLHTLNYKSPIDESPAWQAFSSSDPAASGIYRAAHLRKLIIDFGSRFGGTAGSIFKYLPRSLQKLDIDSSRSRVTADELKDLPPSLVALKLRFRKLREPRPWVHALPKHLKTLNTSFSMSGSEFTELPQSLTKISAHAFDVTLDHVIALPKHLNKVFMAIRRTPASSSSDNFIRNGQLQGLITAFTPFWLIQGVPRELLEFEMAEGARLNQLEHEEAAKEGYDVTLIDEEEAFSDRDDNELKTKKKDDDSEDEDTKDAEVAANDEASASNDDDRDAEDEDAEGEDDENDEKDGDDGDDGDGEAAAALQDEENEDEGDDEKDDAESPKMDVVAPEEDDEAEDDEGDEDGEDGEGDDEENGEEGEDSEGDEDDGDADQDEQLSPDDVFADPQQSDIDPHTIRRIRGLP